jgi:hypothetical protein
MQGGKGGRGAGGVGGNGPPGACGGTIVMIWAFGDVPSGCAVGVSGPGYQIIILMIILATIIILICNRAYDNGPVGRQLGLVGAVTCRAA